MTNPETGEHMGFLKEVMPGKTELSEPRMTLHQRNVWEDGWLMEAHFIFKNYTEQQGIHCVFTAVLLFKLPGVLDVS